MVKVGQMVRFEPLRDMQYSLLGEENRYHEVTGRVAAINGRGRWFSVEYTEHGVKQRASLQFEDIENGTVVICG